MPPHTNQRSILVIVMVMTGKHLDLNGILSRMINVWWSQKKKQELEIVEVLITKYASKI